MRHGSRGLLFGSLIAGICAQQVLEALLRRASVVDDGVDLARGGHLDFVLVGQLHDRPAGLDALRDLLHRLDDLVDRLALGQPLPDGAVAAERADAGGEKVSDSAQASEGLGCPPIATPSRVISAIARHITSARVLSPLCRPAAIPAAIANTFLSAPAISAPTTSVLRWILNRSRENTLFIVIATCSSGIATTAAVLSPASTSLARFGPVRTPAG